MLKITAFKNKKHVKNVKAKDLPKFISEKGVVWVDVERGNEKDYDFLAKTFNIHPLTIDDMKSTNSLPKIDMLQDRYIFVVFHSIYYDRKSSKIRTNEIDFCIGENFLVTVHTAPFESVDNFRSKLMSGTVKPRAGPDGLMHRIMDIEVDTFIQLIDDLDDEVERMETRLIRGDTEKTLQQLNAHRRQISGLKKIVGPERELINKMSRGESPFISKHMLFYFRDIYDHIFRFYLGLDAHRELIASTIETYTSVQSNSINQVTKQLTIIATIFLPLTFLTGIYGMNFRVMPELDFEYGYFFSVAAMAAIGLGMWFYFKKKKY